MSDSPILSSSPPEQAMGLEGVVTKSPPKAMSSDGEVPKSPPKPMISDDVATGSPAERTLDAPDEVNIDQPSTSTGVGARGPPVVKAGRPRHVYAVRESLLEIAAAYAQEDLDKKINEGKESEEAMKYLNDAKQLREFKEP